jgi:hypothetical protein
VYKLYVVVERGGNVLRIKLKLEQLNFLSKDLPFEVMLERPSDVRGLLEIVGQSMPWDETGLSKYEGSSRKPNRMTFSVEANEKDFICDIHPALVQHIYTMLSPKR